MAVYMNGQITATHRILTTLMPDQHQASRKPDCDKTCSKIWFLFVMLQGETICTISWHCCLLCKG